MITIIGMRVIMHSATIMVVDMRNDDKKGCWE
jgi:hypothetical protein